MTVAPASATMKKTVLIIGILVIGAAAVVCFLAWNVFDYAGRPFRNDISEKAITVFPGQHFKMIARQLEKAGITRDSLRFKLFARFKGYDKRIKAGEYRLSAALSPKQILEIMVSGKVALYRITIPEGYNLIQIAGIVSEMGLTDTQAFVQAAVDPAIVTRTGGGSRLVGRIPVSGYVSFSQRVALGRDYGRHGESLSRGIFGRVADAGPPNGHAIASGRHPGIYYRKRDRCGI